MPSSYYFTNFTSEVKLLLDMYKYTLKHPFRQNIFKQTYRNVVFRYNILTLALYTLHCIREFKHKWHQIFKANYCLKHFKLVCFINANLALFSYEYCNTFSFLKVNPYFYQFCPWNQPDSHSLDLNHDESCWSEIVNIFYRVWFWNMKSFITLALKLKYKIDITRYSTGSGRADIIHVKKLTFQSVIINMYLY